MASRSLGRGHVVEVNACTYNDGRVLAEIVDGNGHVVEGFGREECRGFSGDSIRSQLSWEGGLTCPTDGCHLRVILRRAMLYGIETRKDSKAAGGAIRNG